MSRAESPAPHSLFHPFPHPGQPVRYAGVGPLFAQAAILSEASAHFQAGQAVLVLVQDEREAQSWDQALQFWAAHLPNTLAPIRFFPNDPQLPARLFSKQSTLGVVPITALLQPIPGQEQLHRTTFLIRRGVRLKPSSFLEWLRDVGYEHDWQAQRPGTYTRRGGIITAFPPDRTRPIRVEFDEQTVATVSTIDWATQQTLEALAEVLLPPIHWGPGEQNANLLAYAHTAGALFLLTDPDRFDATTPGWQDIADALSKERGVQFLSFTRDAKSADLGVTHAPLFHSRFDEFLAALEQFAHEDYEVFLTTADGDALRTLFREKKFAFTGHLLPAPPIATPGFSDPERKRVVLTDQEIFGFQRRPGRGRAERRVARSFIFALTPGDAVVHLDHGIGNFEGMTTQQVNGADHEYFVLSYAEGDKLFVPVELAEKLAKYIGSSNPTLHRLSGSNWNEIKLRIKEETAHMAQELLRLYASRASARAKALAPQSNESELADSFPYRETPDQANAITAVLEDLAQDTPMDRLVCGDVGFGKTEVAIRAAFRSVMNKRQVVVLCPTTILAQQHLDTFRQRLKGFPVNIELLSRFRTVKSQNQVIRELATGDIDIIIGTHRLLSPDVAFHDLGLIIIDEEQRFGVKDKEKLKNMRSEAHILTLTATPIPRTLNLALSGLREISLIETPPNGRLPIDTLIQPYDEAVIREAIEKEFARGGQAYFLYNNVERIALMAERLGRLIPKARIGIAHGQLPEHKLAEAMAEFDDGRTNLLVCSTIIENGLDLPNVNTMIVENTTQYGLAQLYQLRGRIGRGTVQATAYFFYHAKKLTGQAQKRLQALLEAKALGSGSQIALRDMEIRGVGNILGKEQHGRVAQIGLALYSRLLAQAVEELRTGKPQTQMRDVQLDLPLEIAIPKELVPSEPKRIKLYQELAMLDSVEELEEFRREEFKDAKHPKLLNLFALLEFKMLAQPTTVSSIQMLPIPGQTFGKRIIVKFAESLRPEQLGQLLQRNEHWTFTTDQIKIDAADFAEDWIKELKATLRIFSNDVPQAAEVPPKKNGRGKKSA